MDNKPSEAVEWLERNYDDYVYTLHGVDESHRYMAGLRRTRWAPLSYELGYGSACRQPMFMLKTDEPGVGMVPWRWYADDPIPLDRGDA